MPTKNPIKRSHALERLIKRAKELTQERGHEPTKARLHPSGIHAIIECQRAGCQAWVQVTTKPKSNQIDIGGPMIAVGCPHHDRNK